VERGLEVHDAEVLERRHLIQEVMCHFQATLNLQRFGQEWSDLQVLAADGLVELQREGEGHGVVRVTTEGRWLIRTIAAVFDPQQRLQARGSRLV
jgi:oxygen-independent coproporphyrinogen-3 oxidase